MIWYVSLVHIIDIDLTIRGVVPIVDQWKFIRRFYAQDHGTASGPILYGNILSVNVFLFKEIENILAYLVITNCCQQTGLYAQAGTAYGNIQGRPAHKGIKPL